jgi:hypothetical protein
MGQAACWRCIACAGSEVREGSNTGEHGAGQKLLMSNSCTTARLEQAGAPRHTASVRTEAAPWD